ncbi:MAG TPA: ABC transporter permease [Candidatus Limnocylindrales bacterium]|nr:ABC transporter permease [Candidatus Limnocylindrales bacterium]
MIRFIIRRTIFLLATVFVVSVLAFVIPYLSEADPARMILRARLGGELALDPATVEAVRRQYGLDQPIPVQYLRWAEAAVTGDFGQSFTNRQPVGGIVLRALGVSFLLALSALVLATIIAVPLGILAALRPGGKRDSLIMTLTQGLVALPEYWLAPLGMLVFALWLGWLPAAGWTSPMSVILPASVLALRPLAYLLGVTRASMITVLESPYITAARSRGLSQLLTLRRHALKNAMVPVMTLFSIWLAGTLGGSVVIEVIFNIPGLGRVMYDAVVNADMPVLQAGVIATVGLAIVINTLTDIGYAVANPAILVGESRG